MASPDYSLTNKPFLSVTGTQPWQIGQPRQVEQPEEQYWTTSGKGNLFAGKTEGLMGAGSPFAGVVEGRTEQPGFEPKLKNCYA